MMVIHIDKQTWNVQQANCCSIDVRYLLLIGSILCVCRMIGIFQILNNHYLKITISTHDDWLFLTTTINSEIRKSNKNFNEVNEIENCFFVYKYHQINGWMDCCCCCCCFSSWPFAFVQFRFSSVRLLLSLLSIIKSNFKSMQMFDDFNFFFDWQV